MQFMNKERYYMSMVTYSSVIVSLIYDMICTRIDMAHAVNVMIMFMSNPRNTY